MEWVAFNRWSVRAGHLYDTALTQTKGDQSIRKSMTQRRKCLQRGPHKPDYAHYMQENKGNVHQATRQSMRDGLSQSPRAYTFLKTVAITCTLRRSQVRQHTKGRRRNGILSRRFPLFQIKKNIKMRERFWQLDVTLLFRSSCIHSYTYLHINGVGAFILMYI